MKTITILLGNSDNKLTQGEWADFCSQVGIAIGLRAKTIHFNGFSLPNSPYQNACWVIELGPDSRLEHALSAIRKEFRQESIGWVEADSVSFI